MSNINLNKAELAALDLLIEEMRGSRVGVTTEEARFTPALLRVTRVVTRVTRYTPVVTEAIGSVTQRETSEAKLQQYAGDITSDISLDTLIELRRKATGQE